MFVKMKTTLGTPWGVHIAGKVYDVPDAIGAEWRRKSIADLSDVPPDYIVQLFDRLNDGDGRPCVFLPHAGMEFGHEIMSRIRLIHFHRASVKVVCCRPGCEVLYPSATYHVTDWNDPIPDVQRVATNAGRMLLWQDIRDRFSECHPVPAGGLTPIQEIHPIHPGIRISFAPKTRGLRADVVLGVRRREFAPERNWPHWQMLARSIVDAGLTFAVVGARETSYDLPGQLFHTGDLDTDASVELLQNCRLYIGTDSGGSHLAAEVGARMLVFRETASQSRDLTPRMKAVNPDRVRVVENGWQSPNRVLSAALDQVFEQVPA